MNANRKFIAGILFFVSFNAMAYSQSSQAPDTWKNVTPTNMTWGYAGVGWIMADPVRKSDIYVFPNERGCWKSTDYGVTFTKVSDGQGAIDQGRAWSGAIDLNPNRNPATPPTMYMPSGYGVGGCWKSTDGGVHWVNVWNGNVYAQDGVTEISSQMGGDVGNMMIVDSLDPNHLICHLHQTGGPTQYNGIFETTNGGTTWKACPVQNHFAFSNHGDQLFAFQGAWFVGHGTTWPNNEIWRTDDRGVTWASAGSFGSPNIGRVVCTVGPATYATGVQSGIYKTTNKGASWTKTGFVGDPSWITATPNKIYAINGTDGKIMTSLINNGNTWTAQTISGPTNGGAFAPAVTFDGANYIIVAAQGDGGIWRYVEPANSSSVINKSSVKSGVTGNDLNKRTMMIMNYRAANPAYQEGFDIRGQRMNSREISRQAVIVRGK